VTFKYPSASPASASNAAEPAPSTSTLTPPASATPPASPVPEGSPTSIDTIRTGDLRGVVLTFGDGTSKQYTCQGNWVLSSTSKGPQLSIASPTMLPYAYFTTGFIMLDGVKIGPSTFVKAEKHNGLIVFHYKSGDLDVWIDPQTMLPKFAKQSGIEASYQFLNPPPRPFPIPKDQENLLQKELQADQATRSLR
jgi:hypothetical protein